MAARPLQTKAYQPNAAPQLVQRPYYEREPAPLLATSPPTKQALRSWWGKFKKTTEGKPLTTEAVDSPPGIFAVPLRQSISYANVAISLVDAEGKSYIYGYVPIIVAKCGVYLKEKATNVEGIFRLSGSEKRIKELRAIFDSPPRYGKGLDWDGYTVHDAANVLRRYLNLLPEPIVPLDLYERFRIPLRGYEAQAVGESEAAQVSESYDLGQTIKKYQKLITELPPLNIQLLLYILDLLAVFASKADENRMTAQNLSAIFQPGLLSHPQHDMAPAEYRLSQDVIVFLINNQDHFLIGMRGTAADEKTVQDVQNGTPPSSTPTTPNPSRGKGSLGRSASTASAGADSLRRGGGLRRNVSVNSRHSRQSNGAPSPASPAYGPTSGLTSGSGVHRSNTVPSKKSPGLPSGRLPKSPEMRSPSASVFTSMNVPASPIPSALVAPMEEAEPRNHFVESPGLSSTSMGTSVFGPSTLAATPERSQEHLIDSVDGKHEGHKEKSFSSLFGRSPVNDSEKKQPNKLRKKRIPGSSNPSAQSSATSLNGPGTSPGLYAAFDTPEHTVLETIPSISHISDMAPGVSYTGATPPLPQGTEQPILSDAGLHIAMRPEYVHHSSEGTLKPKASSNSLRSADMSATDQSDLEPIDDPVLAAEQKEKRKRWRLSRKHDSISSAHITSPKKPNAAESTTSFATSSSRQRMSFSQSDPEPGHLVHTSFTGITGVSDGSEKEKKGPLGWIKERMREAKEEKRARDLEREHGSISKESMGIPRQGSELSAVVGVGSRKKSMEVRTDAAVKPETDRATAAVPQAAPSTVQENEETILTPTPTVVDAQRPTEEVVANVQA